MSGDVDAARLPQIGARLRIDAATAELFEHLAAAGVAAILLKGPSLARWLYTGAERRTYVDCDLLVRPEDLPAAERAMESLGYGRHWTIARCPNGGRSTPATGCITPMYLAGAGRSREREPSCLEPFRAYLEARFDDDPHVFGSVLFEELSVSGSTGPIRRSSVRSAAGVAAVVSVAAVLEV